MNNIKKTVFFLLISLIILGTGGCLFDSSKPVNVYDLGNPKKKCPLDVFVKVTPFLNNSSTSYKMVYKKGEYNVISDPYNRWNSTPGQLITQYLQKKFRGCSIKQNDEKPVYIITGYVDIFEINLEQKTVVLGVEYCLKNRSKTILRTSKTFKEEFITKKPLSFAKAMSKAASELGDDILKNISILSKRKKLQSE